MDKPGKHTKKEILSQPEVWAETLKTIRSQANGLRKYIKTGDYRLVLFTGCGSTYYLSLAAAALFQELVGIPALGVPASEIWLSPASVHPSTLKALMVAISRSGETTETLEACMAFHKRDKGDIMTLSCCPGAALTKAGDINLVFPEAREQSVAQTRAFSSLYLATTALSTLWAGRDDLLDSLSNLPEICQRLVDRYASLAQQFGSNSSIDRFYILGSGSRYGLACELSLKMKEMSLSHSEPFHFMEFRHGPKSMVTAGTLVIGLVSSINYRQEAAVLDDVRRLGGQTLTIGEDKADVVFSSGLDVVVRNILYLPVGQLLAFERAVSKGLDPDRPHNLDKVVKLTQE